MLKRAVSPICDGSAVRPTPSLLSRIDPTTLDSPLALAWNRSFQPSSPRNTSMPLGKASLARMTNGLYITTEAVGNIAVCPFTFCSNLGGLCRLNFLQVSSRPLL